MKTEEPHAETNPEPTASPAAGPGDIPDTAFPIVGIGASAGGLEAFEAFFRACPADSGMAFVLVSHLDPDHGSLLAEIIQRCTAMPVVQALDRMAVAPNHVYVIPPNREMAILRGALQLSLPHEAHGRRMPIDAFLRSLAEDQAENAVGIILSGTASDGTLGLRAVLGAGGICLVQDPASARYDGMPRSAIAAGFASHVLPAGEMAAALLRLARPSALRRATALSAPGQMISGMTEILLHLRGATGHDFSLYRKSTISRSVMRRMALHDIDQVTVYARYLKDHPGEAQALYRDLLVNVTSFFRDPEAFTVLQQTILPPLLAAKEVDEAFRVWVAGCATGEEAYSIAMLLLESLDGLQATKRHELSVQIYATDLDDEAIAVARAGSYPPNIAQDVTPERLCRFFTRSDTGYKVKKEIRRMVTFAVHNVVKDAPFTRLDLLSIRNVLIYMEEELQNRLIPILHYALRPGGVLFISTSESISRHSELFAALDHRWKFYRARPAASARWPRATRGLPRAASMTADSSVGNRRKGSNVAAMSNRALLAAYAPASVTTDAEGNILFVHGDTGRYLRPAPGPVTTNAVEMAREELQAELKAVLIGAAQGAPTLSRDVSVMTAEGLRTVQLAVRILPAQRADANADENLLLLSFQEIAEQRSTASTGDRRKRSVKAVAADRVEQLERELACRTEILQTTIEEHQEANEELQAANEELQATNEELQSANEELETSREELHSLNEEMLTLNAELNARIEQLSGVRNDIKNLLDSVNVGTLFLDHHLTICRYTLETLKIYPLIAGDVGRPLGDIKSNIVGADLLAETQSVLDTLIPCEREVRTTAGAWYLVRIQPYRTLDNVIEGAVLVFTEVTDFKLISEAVRRSEMQLATAQEIAHLGSWELDVATGRVRWSTELFKLYDRPPVSAPMSLQDALDSIVPEDRQGIAAAVQKALDTQTPYDVHYRVRHRDGAIRRMHSRAVTITDAAGRVTSLVGATLDITERRNDLNPP